MRGFKTVRFTKLLDAKVNLGEWCKAIFEQCNFGPLFCVNVGISFTAARKQDQDVQYMYCPKSGASFSATFETRQKALEWADSLKIDTMNIMTHTFLNQDFGEFFKSSGWSCRSPVALHMWIQKWYHFFYQYGTNMISIDESIWYQPE